MQTHSQPSSMPPTAHTPHKRPRESDQYSPSSGSRRGGGQRLTASDLLNAITASSSSSALPSSGSVPNAGGMGAAPPSSMVTSAPGSKSGLSPTDSYSGQYPITKVPRTSASPPPTFGNQRPGGPVFQGNSAGTPRSLTSGTAAPLQQVDAAGPNAATTHTTQQEHQQEEQPQSNHPLLCTLPPTCSRRPTPIASTKDLESHYAKYHAHVCEVKGCGCVFPDARLLELHQTENHDPLAAVRKDRGDKIFACHLVTCDRRFLTPKTRRLHLIEAHKYPKEYFFAVTNKGVGGLLRKWGDGASMIRREWKPRPGQDTDDNKMLEDDEENGDEEDDEENGDEEDDGDEVKDDRADKEKMDTNGNEDKDQDLDFASSRTRNDDVKSTIAMQQAATMYLNPNYRQGSGAGHNGAQIGSGDATDDGLVNAMSSLSLVPTSIRFGRGGKMGGFANNSRHNYPDGHGQAGRGGPSNGRSGTGHVRSGSHSHDSEGNMGSENQKQQSLGTGSGQQQQTSQMGHGGHGDHHPQRGLGWAARSRSGVFPVRARRGRGVAL